MSENSQILERLLAGEQLRVQEAIELVTHMAQGAFPVAQVATILTALRMRPLAIDELTGLRQGLMQLAKTVDLSQHQAIDVCGTGGDAKNSFNVSTAVAFVVAGAGVAVAKHGNHGVSSRCGSSTVLEKLGVQFSDSASVLNRQLERAKICFLHAQLFHPALKNFAALRKELGFKTFFNLMGPLLNPSCVNAQLVGVYSLEVGRLFKYFFQRENREATIVHSMDGYDEVSISAPTHVLERDSDAVLLPGDFGLSAPSPMPVAPLADIEDNAAALLALLENRGDANYCAMVLANSALAIRLRRREFSLNDAVALAQESIASGRALKALRVLQEG